MKQIRVILAESHPVMRAGLRYFLQKGTDIVVLAETDKGSEVLNLAALYVPDMIILDISLQGTTCFEIIQRLQVRLMDLMP
jgi:DNA-binding NarL/FixJ family response regulator